MRRRDLPFKEANWYEVGTIMRCVRFSDIIMRKNVVFFF